jgi:hypothetical protein
MSEGCEERSKYHTHAFVVSKSNLASDGTSSSGTGSSSSRKPTNSAPLCAEAPPKVTYFGGAGMTRDSAAHRTGSGSTQLSHNQTTQHPLRGAARTHRYTSSNHGYYCGLVGTPAHRQARAPARTHRDAGKPAHAAAHALSARVTQTVTITIAHARTRHVAGITCKLRWYGCSPTSLRMASQAWSRPAARNTRRLEIPARRIGVRRKR